MKTMTELISWFQLEYPELVAQMKYSNHHKTELDSFMLGEIKSTNGTSTGRIDSLNPYHLESDVFTHTLLVCKQAENAPYEVQIAALLHDIGKPSTRSVNPKNGNVSFHNHDAVSAFMSLEILKREELGLSKSMIIRIFNMIALHTQIYKLSIEQLAAIGDPMLLKGLIMLGKADHAGRFHTKGEAVIPEYRELRWYEKEVPMKDPEKEAIILCGLPGSGKSTYIDNKYGGTSENFSVISRDAYIESCGGEDYNEKWKNCDQKKADRYLQDRFNDVKKFPTSTTIVDMTHMSKKSRRRSLSHFDSSYKKKCVVFLTDLPTLNLQNSERCGKVIGKKVIERMVRSFYPPTYEEFDEIEYVL